MSAELREALTAAGASALIPKIIDPLLLEYQRRYSPLCRALPTVRWGSDTYYFNQRTAVANGGFVGDGGATPVSNSVYVQNSFQMKHLMVVGAVTGYATEVTQQVIGDLRMTEIEGSIRGLYWDLETAICWGNNAATANGAKPQFDGLDAQVSTFSGANQNALDRGGNTLNLAMLDELIDLAETNAAMSIFDDSWMIVTSSTGVSKLAQLLTNQQRFNDKVEIAAGLLVPTYRDIPLVKTSFLSARNFQMSALSTASATTGGSLPAATTYFYRVSAVIARQGEIQPSAEVSQLTGGTSTNTITLSFSPPTGQDGSQPIHYKVYRGTAAGNETFLGYVDAAFALQADGVTPYSTTSIVDTGVALVPQNGGNVPNPLPAQYYGTNAGMFPPGVGQENIYLIPRDKNFLVRPYVREAMPVDIYPTTNSPDSLPYALISDTCLATRAPRYLSRLSRVAVSV
ncbi:MAG: hypothetical protein JWL97_3985 [Gemmatimonadales bacterium]|nr:hypothetical protein [Gemmatimonadales bacterium]